MFGKVTKIDGNYIYLENKLHTTLPEYMNFHVIFDEKNIKIVGEIIFINEEIIKILLVGEIENGSFSSGVLKKPSGSSVPRIISVPELELIIGKNKTVKEELLVGKSSIYNDFNVSIPINDFFANHSAIIGNSGSGKSCGVARILQNLLVTNPFKPVNAHIVLFDAYGEYVNTFSNIDDSPINVKKYSTHPESSDEEALRFPTYFLDAEDLAVLLSLEDPNQMPVLEKALKLVYIFKNDNPETIEYKNDIIAKALLDVLTSGNNSSQIRNQIIAVLTHYNTESLNLNSIIRQPGYNRTLQQCLMIDDQGKMAAISDVMNFFKAFEKVESENAFAPKDFAYSLEELYTALEFALINEGSSKAYEKNNMLKSRLMSIINSDKKEIFNYHGYISKEKYIEEFFSTDSGAKAQLVNVNLKHLDDCFAKVITKLYSKLFFNFTTSLDSRGSYAINIILEEAHRYVQNDHDVDVIGYNIFDRIAKEGRKYGTLLTFITQRPSELSSTALSQCSNFIVFRLFHPRDLEIIHSMSTNLNEDTLEKLKSLTPGNAMIFGNSIKLPLLVKLSLPTPMPESTSLNISGLWYE